MAINGHPYLRITNYECRYMHGEGCIYKNKSEIQIRVAVKGHSY